LWRRLTVTLRTPLCTSARSGSAAIPAAPVPLRHVDALLAAVAVHADTPLAHIRERLAPKPNAP
jgi:hypothetical protein